MLFIILLVLVYFLFSEIYYFFKLFYYFLCFIYKRYEQTTLFTLEIHIDPWLIFLRGSKIYVAPINTLQNQVKLFNIKFHFKMKKMKGEK